MTTNINLYFLPMSTVGLASDAALAPQADGAVAQIVALLFIPSAAPGTGKGQTDFESLGQALLAWALNGFAAGAPPDAPTTPVTCAQLAALIGQPRSPAMRTSAQMMAFLSGQFTFTFNGPKSLPAGVELALFPMFPSLQLSTSDGSHTVDFGTYRTTSPLYQQFLASYFGSLAASVGGQPSGSGSVKGAGTSESLAASLLTDYLQLVWRQVVGDAKTWLTQSNATSTTLGALASNGVFNGAAGFASRFLLHGLRLPDPAAQLPPPYTWATLPPAQMATLPLYPLFVLSGQQWSAPAIPSTGAFSYTMTLAPGSVAPPSGLFANLNATQPLTVDLNDLQIDAQTHDGTALVQDYEKVLAASATDPLGLASVGPPAPIVPYVVSPPSAALPKRFALSSRTAWQGQGSTLVSFSDPLRTQIGMSSVDLRIGSVSPSDPPSTPPGWLPTSPAGAFAWATRVDFSVRPAIDPAGSAAPIPSVYDIRAATQSGREDLFALLTYLQANNLGATAFTIAIAYASGGVLTSDAQPAVLLVRANLSTETTVEVASPLAAAELDAVDHSADQVANFQTDFLTLLWDASVVDTGGYYLYYNQKSDGSGAGLPDTLFTAGPSGTLTVVVTLAAQGPAQPFHNAAVCTPTATVPVKSDAIFVVEANLDAQTYPGWLTRRAMLAPGNVGVTLTRTSPSAATAPTDPVALAQSQLATMFNLLGVWIEPTSAFNESPEGLPLGPVQSQAPNATATNPTAPWTYQRVLAVAPYGASAPGNPYAGVGQSVRLGFLWHDLFGNRLVSDAHAQTLDVPLGYRDPLLPLTQWPGTSASYVFGQGRALTVTLGFVTSRYTSASMQTILGRAQADSARYLLIGYQLAQPDVTVAVTCTADGGVTHTLADKTGILSFVTAAKAYVDAVVASLTPLPSATPPLPPTPPALSLAVTVTLGAGAPAAVIVPLDVEMVISRDSHGENLIDPAFTQEPGVTSVSSPVRPSLDPSPTAGTTANDPLLLRAFAASFEALFPPLKLASGTLDDSGQLYVVELQGSRLGFALPAQPAPHFFAPPPLSVVPWAATNVGIQPYTSGSLLPTTVSTAVPTSFRGIDLDTWGRGFLHDVDRMLSPQYAVAFHRCDPASYRALLTAKETLAAAIAAGVDEIIAGGSGGDLAAAQEALRQSLLVSLSEAYLVDAIVQIPVTVTSPADAALPPPAPAPATTAADTVLRFSFQPRGIVPVPPNATLASLETLLGVPIELIAELIADNANLLVPGFVVTFKGQTYTVQAGDSLRGVATALKVDVLDLARDPGVISTPGLFQAGASLDVIKRAYTVQAGDTMRSVLDFLAPELMASGDPTDAITDFLDVNHALPGIFTDKVQVQIAGTTYTLSGSGTLDALIAQVGLAPVALVAALLDLPEVLAVGVVVGFLSAMPGHTLSQATVDVQGGGPATRQQPLTFLLEIASHAQYANLALSLSFPLGQLEYAISTPAPWAAGYEESDWLSFILPPTGSVGTVDIPIPLRAYPTPPTVDDHQIVPAPSAPSAQPTLASIRAYTYELTYTYSRAAQDQMSLSVTYNQLTIDDPTAAASGTAAIPDLAQCLAQYAAIAAPLNADLTTLAAAPTGPSAPTNAVKTFAAQASAVAAAWKAWQAPVPAPLGASHVVLQSTGAGGQTQVVVKAATPGAPLPTVTPVGQEPTFQLPGTAHTVTTFQAAAGTTPPVDQFTYETPTGSLDVIQQQSAWGSVTVTRNQALLGGQSTNPAFIYQIADARFYSPAVPLVTYRAPFNLALVTTRLTPAPSSKLWALLAGFFAELLGVTAASPATGGPGLRVAVSFGTLLAGAPTASAGASASIVSLLPVLLSPVATFNPQVDLLAQGGLCNRLVLAMNSFLSTNKPATLGARWVLDVSVYTSLAAEGTPSPRPPLLELTDVQLALADAPD